MVIVLWIFYISASFKRGEKYLCYNKKETIKLCYKPQTGQSFLSNDEGYNKSDDFFFLETATDAEKSDFMREISLLRNMEPHPNVVRFLGSCTETGSEVTGLEYPPTHIHINTHRAICMYALMNT